MTNAEPGPARRFRAADRVVSRAIGGETLLLDLATGRYFDLDDSGSFVWDKLTAGAPLEAIVDSLEDAFDAPRERLAADVAAFVGELERERLVVADD